MKRKIKKTAFRQPAVYRSAIPKRAREVVKQRYPSGAKISAQYLVDGRDCGYRTWYENGQLEHERGDSSEGRRIGYEYEFAPNGRMMFKSRYVDGLEDGTARQWNDRGELLITYTKRRGVGLDLWCDWMTGKLTEEKYIPRVGELGYERWWENSRRIYREAYWISDVGWHGIEREWNQHGQLARGFPKYYVRDKRVTKRQYLQACQTDPTLPPFVAAENRPYRKLPRKFVEQVAKIRRPKRG